MRLGIVLRLVGVLILGSVIALEGSAIKNRTFEGKSEHYTVVLTDTANPNVVASRIAHNGVHVEHVINTDSTKALLVSVPSKQADVVRADLQVSYIEMDSQKVVHHSWWDTTMITLGLRTPHLT